MTTSNNKSYNVFARTYRPQKFSEVIGQEALVKTLQNALTSGRIAHAFLFTGTRGIGKTSTARLLAKALNCTSPITDHGYEPCGTCEHCLAISSDRDVDVLEMDAASRTGVDDVRELIEGLQYRPAKAKYKIYIIDEVHMLSKSAFNALLKTLEEPPAHVKFIFATTEIGRVPITILSRCQRFDLRRISGKNLEEHFKKILDKEKISFDPKALTLIAHAADGSARDGLSLLDQAVTLGNGKEISYDTTSQMLGLADSTLIFALFTALGEGKVEEALSTFNKLYTSGAEPLNILKELMELTHWVSCTLAAPNLLQDETLSEIYQTKGKELTEKLTIPQLSRMWQILLKGTQEAATAPSAEMAVEMVLIRLAYIAELPTPQQLIKSLSTPSNDSAPQETASAPMPTLANPTSFEDVIKLAEDNREMLLAVTLQKDVHLVSFGPEKISLRLGEKAPKSLATTLSKLLLKWTGKTWDITTCDEQGEKTVEVQEKEKTLADPMVKTALESFPGAKISS